MNSHCWEVIKEEEKAVESDILGTEECKEQGLSSQYREDASMPQSPEVRAQGSR